MPVKLKAGSAELKKPSGNKGINTKFGDEMRLDLMVQSALERTSEQIADTSRKASRAASAVADAVGDGVGAARRVAKQSGDAAEEFIDDTTRRLQRHPVETVATTFALGVAAGILIGCLAKRKR
jgi:ElaB/YqjD/DUF883 family membrane-anchored ribosome-binding protein